MKRGGSIVILSVQINPAFDQVLSYLAGVGFDGEVEQALVLFVDVGDGEEVGLD